MYSQYIHSTCRQTYPIHVNFHLRNLQSHSISQRERKKKKKREQQQQKILNNGPKFKEQKFNGHEQKFNLNSLPKIGLIHRTGHDHGQVQSQKIFVTRLTTSTYWYHHP